MWRANSGVIGNLAVVVRIITAVVLCDPKGANDFFLWDPYLASFVIRTLGRKKRRTGHGLCASLRSGGHSVVKEHLMHRATTRLLAALRISGSGRWPPLRDSMHSSDRRQPQLGDILTLFSSAAAEHP